ncbi:MAG: hypothetical protein JWM34_2715 [Ilumatobacteraceae bacterium]|nr:hypothetical protein [Ilumatobacteraceae bacterium]
MAAPTYDMPFDSFESGRRRIDEKYSSSSWRSLPMQEPMTYTLHPEEISAELTDASRDDVVVGRRYPAVGLALIVAVDVAVYWVLRSVF